MPSLRSLAFVVLSALVSACGGSSGDGSPGGIQVGSGAGSDSDGRYPTGSVIAITIDVPSGFDAVGGSIRIRSKSQGYDSKPQPLVIADPVVYHWFTAGLAPATDYRVLATLTGADGSKLTDDSLTITLQLNPPHVTRLVSELDLRVQAPGLPLEFIRTYLLDSSFDGPMGYGWTHTFLMSVVESSDGTVKLFEADGSGSYFQPSGSATYSAQPGDYRALSKMGNGAFKLQVPLGPTFDFQAGPGRLARITDRNGNAIDLHYDSMGRLSSVIDPANQATTLSYTSANRVAAIIDPVGRATTYSYDPGGNLIACTHPGNRTTQYAYDTAHNLNTITDPAGRTIHFGIDAKAERLKSVSKANGDNQLAFQYGIPQADQITITDGLSNASIMTFDLLAQVVSVQDALGNRVSYTYDSNGNLTGIADPNGGQTALKYDSRGNVLELTNAKTDTVLFGYDPVTGWMKDLTDARGYSIHFQYDTAGNLTSLRYPDDTVELYSYDAQGNVVSRTDRMGRTIQFAYESTGRLLAKVFPDGTSDTFVYDSRGNLVALSDDTGVLSVAYDAADRIASVATAAGEVVSYTYDESNAVASTTYPDGTIVDYAYDGSGRPIEIRASGSTVATYMYDSMSRVVSRTLGNGTTGSYQHDAVHRLLRIVNRRPTGEVLSQFDHTYDALGNRTSVVTPQLTTQFAYDPTLRLVSATDSSDQAAYHLDAAGNRTSVVRNGTTVAYAVNALNQYAVVGTDPLSYDANGNLTQRTSVSGTTDYSYDFENRLIKVVTPSDVVTFSYDPYGRRVSKSSAAGTLRHVYDGFHPIMETDGAGSTLAKYYFGIWTDEILMMERGSQRFYYAHDAIRSVVGLTDTAAAPVESYAYDTYGTPQGVSLVGNPYYFAGRVLDVETGLYFNRARYYDPGLGRFLTPDPARFRAGPNLYTYAENNPTTYVDPSGQLLQIPVWVYTVYNSALGCMASPSCVAFFQGVLYGLMDAPPIPPQRPPTPIGWLLGQMGRRVGGLPRNLWNAFMNAGPAQPLAEPGGCYDMEIIVCDYSGLLYPGASGGGQSSGGGVFAGDPSFVQLPRGASSELSSEPSGEQSLVARISFPVERSLVRAEVPVFGLAGGNQFAGYLLEFGQGVAPNEWHLIASGAEPTSASFLPGDVDDTSETPIRGNLGTWDTGLREYVYLPTYPADHPVDLHGTHTLRLTVTGHDGSVARHQVVVDVGTVVPNALGGVVVSSDGRARLRVSEHSLSRAFALFDIRPVEDTLDVPGPDAAVGSVYVVREPGETFASPATIEFEFPAEGPAKHLAHQLDVLQWDAIDSRWVALPTARCSNADRLTAPVHVLASYYVVVESSRVLGAVSGQDRDQGSMTLASGDSLPSVDTFDDGRVTWSARSGVFGPFLQLVDASSSSDQCLRITSPRIDSHFACTVRASSFDVREYSRLQFDYRATPGLHADLYARVADRWYQIGFTDEPDDVRYERVNIAPIGRIEGVACDGRWHTAQLDLHDMLRTMTGNTRVDELVLADWNVPGFMKLAPGNGGIGEALCIDDFAILPTANRAPQANSLVVVGAELPWIEDGDPAGDPGTCFGSPVAADPVVSFGKDPAGDEAECLRLAYDVRTEAAYSGYALPLGDLDSRPFNAIQIEYQLLPASDDVSLGLRDSQGEECKLWLSPYVRQVQGDWRKACIPLVAFPDSLARGSLTQLTLTFEHPLSTTGTIEVKRLELLSKLEEVLVEDFEDPNGFGPFGREDRTYSRGVAAIRAERVPDAHGQVLAVSYGGSIGSPVFGEDGLSYAAWATNLGGIDVSNCSWLSMRLRSTGARQLPNVYLDDGSHRWGVDFDDYLDASDGWQTVRIPLHAFSAMGVDLTHLWELQIACEWKDMSGTVLVDDIWIQSSSCTDTDRSAESMAVTSTGEPGVPLDAMRASGRDE